MATFFRRSLSLLLAFVMLCSGSVFAIANEKTAEKNEYQQFESYFGIGDSITQGYGLPGYKNYNLSLNPGYDPSLPDPLHGLPGSGLYDVAAGVGLGDDEDLLNRNFMAYHGQRVADALYCLGCDVDFSEDEYMNQVFGSTFQLMKEQMCKDADGAGTFFIDKVKEADLITIALGNADVFYSAQMTSGINSVFSSTATTEDKLTAVEKFTCSMVSNTVEYLAKELSRNKLNIM